MLELQCCTRLSSTVVTLLIMLIYWWLFDDCLNLMQLVVSAEPLADNTIVQKLEACRRTHSNGLTGDCSHLAASYWHRYYLLNRDVSSLSKDEDFSTPENQQWSITKTLCFLMVVVSMIVGLLSAAALGSLLTIAIFLKSGKKYQLRTRMPSRLKALYTLKKRVSLTNPLGRSCCCCPASCGSSRVNSPNHASPLSSQRHHSPGCDQGDPFAQEVVSRPVDAALASLLDTALECELLPWYRLLVMDTKPALGEIRKCAWHVVSRLAELGRGMDGVGFLTGGVAACLTRHLQRIRLAQQAGEKAGERGVLELVPQLSSPERERNFLRRLAEYLLLHTLPRSSYDCLPLRTVLRELLACKILEVCVDVVCSPDWINQQIVFLLPKQPAQKHTALPKTPTGVVAAGKSSLSSSSKLLLGDSEAIAWTMPGASGGGSGNYGRFIRQLLSSSASGGGCVEGDEGGIERLVAVIQACTDEEKLEAARQFLHKELLCTLSGGVASASGEVGINKEFSTNNGEAAGAEKDVSAYHSGTVADRDASSTNGVAAPVPSSGGWRNLTGSKQQREHKVVVSEWPAAFFERGVSEMTRARAECERRLLAVKAGLADIGDHADKMFPSASFSSVLESAFCRRHLHHYLQSLQAALAGEGGDDDPITADACGKGVDATDAHESNACDTLKGVGTLKVHSGGLCDVEEEERDSIGHIDDESREKNITYDQKGAVMAETSKQKVATSCSGVAALGLYCSLQELLAAPCRSHEALLTQIYSTYLSADCTHPVPIDEVVQEHIWQLVLAGSRGVGGVDGTCAPASCSGKSVGASGACSTPLIGCLAGAVEEVGQFLQTRYSAGFLHSSHYRAMMAEATVMGHSIATGTSSLDVLTKTTGLIGLGPPCTLQQQLHYAQSTLALHQERQTYKTWAMNSLSEEEENIIKKCRREVDEAAKMSRQYETHLHTLQLWIDNFGKWRIHVQGVETTDEKENPEIILLVSLDEESPILSCLQAPSQSSTPSPQYPRSPQLPRKSPQPPRSPIPPPRSPQHRSKPTQGHSTISSMANSVLYSTLSAISTATADSLPPLSEKLSPGSYEETSSCIGNSDALIGAKSKSLSFDKDYYGAAVVSDASGKSSTSLDKLPNLPDKSRCSSSSSSEKHPGALVKSKGSMEKSSDSLKSKSSTGSLERLIGNFSGSLSKSSSCCSSDQAPSFASSAATATAETAGDSDETFAGGGVGGRGLTVVDHRDDMDGWVVVRRLTHLTDLHKKLCMYWPSLKSREVPSLPSKSIFSKASGSERACLDRLRAACQRYLSALTWDALDPGPARSLLFYELVCPTQHLLWRPQPAVPTAKKSKFSLSSFFKGRDGRGDSDGEDDPSSSSLTEPLSRRLAAFADTASVVASATPSSGASGSGGAAATLTAAVTKQEQRSTTASIASQLFGGDKILSKSCEIDVACSTTAEERDTVGAFIGDVGLEDIKAGGGGAVLREKSSVSDKVDGIFSDWKAAGRTAMSCGTEKQSLLSAVTNSNNRAADKPNSQSKASDKSGNPISRAASAESDKQVPQNNSTSAKGSSGVAFGRGSGNSSTTSVGGGGISGKVPTSAGKHGAGGGVHGASGGEAVVAEPLFALLEELCELRGMGKLIRKTLVTFVQMTYGKNITKHVRETASGLLSEEMIVRYISALEKGLWPEPHTSLLGAGKGKHEQRPNESTATHYQRTQKQISDTRQEARVAVLAAVPASLGTLVGASSATRGAHRLFAALQHHALNKNLFYNILEELLQEVFPELREKMESAAQH